MTRKTNLYQRTNPSNTVSAETSSTKYRIYLNRNLIENVVAANIRRGFVIVLLIPLVVINGVIATKKIRGKVKLVPIKRNSI